MKKNSWLSNDAAYFSFWEIPLRQIWTCSFITPGNFLYIILCIWPKPPHFSVTNLNNKALDVAQWVSACCASMCEHDDQCLDPLQLCETQVQQCMFGAPGQAGKNKSIWGACEATREAEKVTSGFIKRPCLKERKMESNRGWQSILTSGLRTQTHKMDHLQRCLNSWVFMGIPPNICYIKTSLKPTI